MELDKEEGFKLAKATRIQYPFENLSKSIIQKGNTLLGLGKFEEAKACYESLRTFGENASADRYLKQVRDAQERDKYISVVCCSQNLWPIRYWP